MSEISAKWIERVARELDYQFSSFECECIDACRDDTSTQCLLFKQALAAALAEAEKRGRVAEAVWAVNFLRSDLVLGNWRVAIFQNAIDARHAALTNSAPGGANVER